MKKSHLLGVVCAVLSILTSVEVSAALHGVLPATPGGTDYQAYYDDVADLTWLADAKAAGNTRVDWNTAMAWAASLNINGVTGWRLPNTNPIDGTTADDNLTSNIGHEDAGYNVSAPGTLFAGSTASEMAYLYHHTLGNKSRCDLASSSTNNCVTQPGGGFTNSGPFSNIQPYYYWSATTYALDTSKAWGFHFTLGGHQAVDGKPGTRWVWAVHSGNAGALPLDSNGDGISDADAIALGLDPNDLDGDTDNDGFTDVIEVGGDVNNPLDSDGDGVIDALEPGLDATDATIASGLSLAGGGTVSVTTAAGESLSMVGITDALGGPGGINFAHGSISYKTTAVANASIPVTIVFSIDLPANPAIYKVDHAGVYTELPDTTWRQINARTVEITLTDGDPLTDLDGALDNSIDDPIAIGGAAPAGGGGGGGGCTMNPAATVDPIWSLLLIIPGVGYLRRRFK